jgi:hypothetical protein
LKQCSSCAREIPESATVCDACSQWAADVVISPASVEASQQVAAPAAAGGTKPPAPRAGKKRLPFVLLGVGGAGIMMLALLSARGTPSSGATGGAAPAALPSPSAVPPAASFTQKWSTENRAYWVGNRPKGFAFELPAENTVQVWTRHVQPALVVRCMSQMAQVFVVTESALKIEPETDDHTVTFSFDDEPKVAERWPDSADHDALFAPDGSAFAQRLMRARTLRFGYTPHNADPVVAAFNVNGLGPLIEPAIKECGWR